MARKKKKRNLIKEWFRTKKSLKSGAGMLLGHFILVLVMYLIVESSCGIFKYILGMETRKCECLKDEKK